MKDKMIEIRPKIDNFGPEYVALEKLIPKLPSSFLGLLFRQLPSA